MASPTLGGVTFFKRWHMRYTCFGYCLWVASYLHPTGAIVDEVEVAMAMDISSISASAAPT